MDNFRVKINGLEIKALSIHTAAQKTCLAALQLEEIRASNNLPADYWGDKFNAETSSIDYHVKKEVVIANAEALLKAYNERQAELATPGKMLIDFRPKKAWHQIEISFSRRPKTGFGLALRVDSIDFSGINL